MKGQFLLIGFFALSGVVHSQVSLSFLDEWQLTPNPDDSAGVFCRTFYHEGRNKFYAVYAGRPGTSGSMTYYKWREYDSDFTYTSNSGTLPGLLGAGDFAMQMVDSTYYHITSFPPWSFKLSKYDDDFNLLGSVLIPLDSSDSGADMLLNYTNGKLIVGAFHQAGEYHPSMPDQTLMWTPVMHKWEYDLDLNSLTAPVYLNEVYDTWGSSCIFNGDMYQIVTMSKWPNYKLNVYRYDNSWNYIDSIPLNNDGQWSQGLLWDGTYYYVSYHSGHEHRSGNITIAIYDEDWSLVYDTTITNNSVFIFGSSPPLNTLQYNASRPYLTRVGDTLYVSYDVDDYELISYAGPPLYAQAQQWQAYVTKLQINGLVNGVEENKELNSFQIYPNPALDFITIHSTENGTLEMYSLAGELVYSGLVTAGNQNFELEKLSKGVYIFQLKTPFSVEQRKILVE